VLRTASRTTPSRIERALRILWVKANKILPLHSGGDIRSYNIARHLATQHELTFCSYYNGDPDDAYQKALQEHFPAAICICAGPGFSTPLGRGLDYAWRLPQRPPYAVSRFASRAVESGLARWYEECAFDVAVCDFLDAAVNFPAELNIPTVLFQHNVESEIWRRHATNGSRGLKKLVYRLEFSKMQGYEAEMVRKFHHVIAVSEHDKKLMSAWLDPSRLSVVPTGVDTMQFHPGAESRQKTGLVLFVGAMDWEPNVDAVEYFCQEIWPGVLARVPEARFRIVGRNPDARVQRLVCDSVEVTGRVPSVIDHLREGAVVVVPLRIGGGTRLKIYEAMAVGKAIVSTTVGAEGLDVHHGRDILLSDTPDSFAESVATLLHDAEGRTRLEHAAAALAANYGWPVIGAKFEQVLQTVANGAASRMAISGRDV
jgi:glycosyltransferase involved in cell wall biosynthesis